MGAFVPRQISRLDSSFAALSFFFFPPDALFRAECGIHGMQKVLPSSYLVFEIFTSGNSVSNSPSALCPLIAFFFS